MRDAIRTYKDRWQAVNEFEREEMRTTSIDMRWMQLNAVVRLAIGLGFIEPDESEASVHQRWAKLKELEASKSLQI
jgi:hypothetical protein